MTGRMIEFDSDGSPTPGYLATPDAAMGATGSGAPGVVVLHGWWGLTEPYRQVCDRLAQAGYLALAPDLYRGKTTAAVAEAEVLGAALDQHVEQWRGDVRGAVRFLRHYGQHENQHEATDAAPTDGRGAVAVIGFSLGGAYALDMSINLADEIAAVVIFYDAYPGLDYGSARAAYLFHYAEDDSFVSAESVVEMEKTLQAAGRQATFYTYPEAKHWFFEANRPDAFNATAAALAWERTRAFLNNELLRS